MGDKLSSNKTKLEEMVAERQFQDAVRLARLTLLSSPQDIESRLLLAKSLMSLARYDDVLAETQITLELDGSRGDAWTLKGEALFFKGAFSKALNALNKAKELKPQNKKVQRLIDEIQVTQDPDEDTGSLDVDTAATKSYPMEDTGELEGDPTEIMEMPPVVEEDFPIDKEESSRRPQETSDDSSDQKTPDDSIPDEELLSVGDSTAIEELPSGLKIPESPKQKPIEPSSRSKDADQKGVEIEPETKELDLNDLEMVSSDQETQEAPTTTQKPPLPALKKTTPKKPPDLPNSRY